MADLAADVVLVRDLELEAAVEASDFQDFRALVFLGDFLAASITSADSVFTMLIGGKWVLASLDTIITTSKREELTKKKKERQLIREEIELLLKHFEEQICDICGRNIYKARQVFSARKVVYCQTCLDNRFHID